jgi:hypothetical protein
MYQILGRLRSGSKKLVGLAFLTFCLVNAAPAQTSITVGDARVDASFIKPYKNRWKETLATSDHRIIDRGVWSDEVQYAEYQGRRVLKRVITVTRPSGKVEVTFTLMVDPRTFEPVMTEENRGGQSLLRFDFQGRRVSGRRPPQVLGGQPRAIEVKLPTRVFDFYGGMNDLFLAVLPLREGYAAKIPCFSGTIGPEADPKAITWTMMEVKRREPITTGSGEKVMAWVVETNTAVGFYKVWVTREPPYVIKTVFLGPGGGRLQYDPL